MAFVRHRVTWFAGAMWLDCLLGALVMAAVGTAVVWPQLAGAFDLAVAGQLLYFIGDLGFLGFLLAALALTGGRAGPSLIFLAVGIGVLAMLDGAGVVNVAAGAQEPPFLQAAGWPAAALLIATAALWRVSDVALSSSGWARVGVPAASAMACLPIVLLSHPGTPHNLLASLALALVVVRLIVSLRNVTRSATTDPLTGLANRQLMIDRIERALLRQSRHGRPLAVLLIDLDEFREINVSARHDVGDRVLLAVGERLRAALRREDTLAGGAASGGRARNTVGRLGGDEFAVLLEDLSDPHDAAAIAERLLAELRTPLTVATHMGTLQASIGATVTTGSGKRGASDLMRDADTAMHAAKRAGKERFQLFETGMHQEVVARTSLTRDLRSAVGGGQLRLVYQPQVDLISGHMTGVEALVRWEHPERGLLTPDRFLPVAESAGMITAIDDWVLREACAQLRRWDGAGLPALSMAVNVSARRLVTGDLASDLEAVLRATQVDPERLEVEITETVAVDHDGAAVAAITRIRGLGVRVAIDDFGMGHSALSRLQSFPVDRLKIDRSFISPLTSHGARGSIADAMIAIGQSLGLEVVAEGVETREHLHALRALGCRCAQGYLFSKPVPQDRIAEVARAGVALSPAADQPVASDAFDFQSSPVNQERLTRTLLAELQRVTGLETTYLTRIDWQEARQHITHARNTGTIGIPEGLTVDWANTICRRALEQGITYTDDVLTTFPDSAAEKDFGMQTHLSVPLIDSNGDIQGTLCGASSNRVSLGHEAIQVMERFGQIMTQGVAPQHANQTPQPHPV